MSLVLFELIMLGLALVLLAIALRAFGAVASLRPLLMLPGAALRWTRQWVRQQVKALAERQKARRQMVATLSAADASIGRKRTLQAVKDGGGDQAWAARLLDNDFATQVQNRLEVSFDLFERERISIDTYQSLLYMELEATQRHMADIRLGMQDGYIERLIGEADLAEAEDLLKAVHWCIDWASSFARVTAGADSGESVPA